MSDEVDAEGLIAVSGDEVADDEEEEQEPLIEGLSGEYKTDDYTQPGEHRLITTALCTLKSVYHIA